ncbi:hypothetical protein FQN53_006209 [Emmonsiellopsis sp. PD_33]|nr:hypothetical protein FQN53_006209 [Emmonsiellopsis sp. PD_33]
MCRPSTCGVCSKKTWFGCGLHIPRVMDEIPKDEWCTCAPKKKVGEVEYPPRVGEAEGASS